MFKLDSLFEDNNDLIYLWNAKINNLKVLLYLDPKLNAFSISNAKLNIFFLWLPYHLFKLYVKCISGVTCYVKILRNVREWMNIFHSASAYVKFDVYVNVALALKSGVIDKTAFLWPSILGGYTLHVYKNKF